MEDNALGESLFDSSVTHVRVLHFPLTPTELEAKVPPHWRHVAAGAHMQGQRRFFYLQQRTPKL